MLVQLSISNFAIIKTLDLTLKPGLNILSGETGAGKSILINAMNLILGGRAFADLIRSGCTEARVEALFSLPESRPLSERLEALGLPFEGEVLIQRTIFKEGRNRIHINGAMATLQMLSRLGPGLISLSGQHEHQLLLHPESHLYLLDDFAGLSGEREALGRLFGEYRQQQEAVGLLEKALAEGEERRDLNRFQMQEIEAAAVRAGEDVELMEEKRRLRHSDQLLEIASEGYQDLYEGRNSALGTVSQWVKRMDKGAEIDARLAPVRDALSDIEARLEDVGLSLRDFRDHLELDPRRLEQVEDRLELLNRLKRKYGGTLEDVVREKDRLASAEANLEESRERLRLLQACRADAAAEILRRATGLSARRKEASEALERAVETELQQLHMKETRFRVYFESGGGKVRPESGEALDTVRADGMDRVEYTLSPNVGEALRPLARIASGGELSRIMLALKTILSRSASVETIIFDEVDSGISGATAEVVGQKLVRLAEYQQVICITHLPQIASKGKAHFLVRKEAACGRTQTVITELASQDRVMEIARLLGGREITPNAVAHARDLLKGEKDAGP